MNDTQKIEFEFKDGDLWCVDYPTMPTGLSCEEQEDFVNKTGGEILQLANEFLADIDPDSDLEISEFEYGWEQKIRQDFPFLINTYLR